MITCFSFANSLTPCYLNSSLSWWQVEKGNDDFKHKKVG